MHPVSVGDFAASDCKGLQLNLSLNSCNSAKILGLVSGGAGIATHNIPPTAALWCNNQ